MKLSIITVNLNNASGLRKTIESVLSQTFRDYEFIIIDGGSTDGSVGVIKEFADKITYWVSESDKGIYNAMNKGILKSRGEYLQFLNSGDWLVDHEVCQAMLHDQKEADIIYGNLIKKMPNGKMIIDKGPGSSNLTLQTFYSGTLNHSSAFIKRELFEKFGYYDENLKITSDWKFFLNAAGLNKSSVIYKDINVAYFDMTGISRTMMDLIVEERTNVLNELIPHPILMDYINNIKYYSNLHIIRKYWITQKTFSIVQFLLKRFSKFIDFLKNIS